MAKQKKKMTKNNTLYYKLFGITWNVIFIIVCANIQTSFVLTCLLFLIGGLSLAYGVILSELKPDVKASRIITFAIAVTIASFMLYSCIYFIINFPKS